MKVTNCLLRIGIKSIPFDNTPPSPPLRKHALILQRQGEYVEDIILTRDTADLGMSSKEVRQMILDIGQASSYIQAENHMDYLIWEKPSAKYEEAWAGN